VPGQLLQPSGYPGHLASVTEVSSGAVVQVDLEQSLPGVQLAARLAVVQVGLALGVVVAAAAAVVVVVAAAAAAAVAVDERSVAAAAAAVVVAAAAGIEDEVVS
jgi:hypothetical protein